MANQTYGKANYGKANYGKKLWQNYGKANSDKTNYGKSMAKPFMAKTNCGIQNPKILARRHQMALEWLDGCVAAALIGLYCSQLPSLSPSA